MDGNSAEKLLRAGFTIIRKDDQPTPRIKVRSGHQSWSTLDKFETKAARDKRYKELLELNHVIQD